MTWLESTPGVVQGGAAVPAHHGDICPSSWTEDFDRAAMSTEVFINRSLPSDIPALRYYFPSTGDGGLSMNGPQSEATVITVSRMQIGGEDITPWLRYADEFGTLRVADEDDDGVTVGYGITGEPTYDATHFAIPVIWTSGQDPVPAGIATVKISPAPEAPDLYFDAYGVNTYGRETFSRTDLISNVRGLFETLADRILEVRGSNSVPRVDSVLLDARRGVGIENAALMATADPGKPSRYRLRLQVDGRLVYDRMMFVTSVRHTIERDEWTAELTLDVAEWAGVL